MSNIISIGSRPESKITAFGDDSKFNKTNAFAFVIFENPKLESARQALANIKEAYGIPVEISLHMRELTNAGFRLKNNLQHITATRLAELLVDIVDEMNKLPFLIKGSYYIGSLPPNIDSELMGVTWSDKGMQSMLATRALIPFRLKNYGYEDLRIVVSHDSTKLQFLGKKKRQAARWAGMFSDVDAPPGFVYKFDPLIQDPAEDILLQFADIIVYMIAHVFDSKPTSTDFRSILDRARNYDIYPYQYPPQPQ